MHAFCPAAVSGPEAIGRDNRLARFTFHPPTPFGRFTMLLLKRMKSDGRDRRDGCLSGVLSQEILRPVFQHQYRPDHGVHLTEAATMSIPKATEFRNVEPLRDGG